MKGESLQQWIVAENLLTGRKVQMIKLYIWDSLLKRACSFMNLCFTSQELNVTVTTGHFLHTKKTTMLQVDYQTYLSDLPEGVMCSALYL